MYLGCNIVGACLILKLNNSSAFTVIIIFAYIKKVTDFNLSLILTIFDYN